jgi:hypothetical protein
METTAYSLRKRECKGKEDKIVEVQNVGQRYRSKNIRLTIYKAAAAPAKDEQGRPSWKWDWAIARSVEVNLDDPRMPENQRIQFSEMLAMSDKQSGSHIFGDLEEETNARK